MSYSACFSKYHSQVLLPFITHSSPRPRCCGSGILHCQEAVTPTQTAQMTLCMRHNHSWHHSLASSPKRVLQQEPWNLALAITRASLLKQTDKLQPRMHQTATNGGFCSLQQE